MSPSDLCYLATPYTHYKSGLDQAFKDAARLAAHLLMAGVKVYSPICHTHPIAVFGGLNPRDHSIWLPFDEAMMAAAQTLIVAHLEGWLESHGIAHEVKFFQAAGKPIFDLDPRSLIMVRRP
jgi:hypothetical protein